LALSKSPWPRQVGQPVNLIFQGTSEPQKPWHAIACFIALTALSLFIAWTCATVELLILSFFVFFHTPNVKRSFNLFWLQVLGLEGQVLVNNTGERPTVVSVEPETRRSAERDTMRGGGMMYVCDGVAQSVVTCTRPWCRAWRCISTAPAATAAHRAVTSMSRGCTLSAAARPAGDLSAYLLTLLGN